MERNLTKTLMEAKRHLDHMCLFIEKVAETSDSVNYAFVADVYETDPTRPSRNRKAGQNRGALQITKEEGEISLVEAMPEDRDNRAFMKAASKVCKHWTMQEFPDKTMFACG